MGWVKLIPWFIALLLPVFIILISRLKSNEQLAERYDYFYSYLKIVLAFDVVKLAAYFHDGLTSSLYHFLYYVSGAVIETYRYYVVSRIYFSVLDENSYKGLAFSLRGFFILALPLILVHDALTVNSLSDKTFVKDLSSVVNNHVVEFNFFLLAILLVGIYLLRNLPTSRNTLGIIFGLTVTTFCHSPFINKILHIYNGTYSSTIQKLMGPMSYLLSMIIYLLYLQSYCAQSFEQQVYVDMRISKIDQFMQRKLGKIWLYSKFATSRTIK